MQSLDESIASADYQQLLRAVTEELKLPLLQIARQAELGYLASKVKPTNQHLHLIERNADAALRLLDTYLFGIQLYSNQQTLPLEPISLGSVLDETAHQLSLTAKQYSVDIELIIAGNKGLVMGHARALQGAFFSLGSTLIANQPVISSKNSVTLAAYPVKDHMVAGVYGHQDAITSKAWQRSLRLYGHSRQPLAVLSGSSAAGIFVADTILRALTTTLKPARFQRRNGLAANLPLSRQLQLI